MNARARIRTRLAIAGAIAAVVLVAFAGSGGAQGILSFSIAPVQFGGGTPRSYFSYTMNEGDTIQDRAFVENDSEEPVLLKVFIADGVTAINGSTAFAEPGEVRNGVGGWLATSVQQVLVGPGESSSIPFTLSVPAGTAPGDHVAGLVVEGPPKAAGGPGVGTSIRERAGVAVVVRVPGPATERLALGKACLNQETGSNYFEVAVENQGSLLTKASGTLTLTRQDGDRVFTQPVELGTVLPDDSTFLRIDAPMDPGPGDYSAALSLTQTNGEEIRSNSDISIGDEKVNGCAGFDSDVDAGPGDGVSDTGDVFHEPDGGGFLPTPSLTSLLLLLLILLAAILVAREVLWRRRRSQ